MYSRFSIHGTDHMPEVGKRYNNRVHFIGRSNTSDIRQLLGLPGVENDIHRMEPEDFTTGDGSGNERYFVRVYLAEHKALHDLAMVVKGVKVAGLPAQKRDWETWAGRCIFVKVQEVRSSQGYL